MSKPRTSKASAKTPAALALAPPVVETDPAIQKMELLVASILKLAKARFDDFVSAKRAGQEPVRFGVTGMSKEIGKQVGVGPLFAYQLISQYMVQRGDVASQKGREGGIVLREEFEANQRARQEKRETTEAEREQKRQARREAKALKEANNSMSKFTERVKHLGYTRETFTKAKAAFGGKPTLLQLKEWIGKNLPGPSLSGPSLSGPSLSGPSHPGSNSPGSNPSVTNRQPIVGT